MGRRYGGPILLFVELYLLIALTAQNVHAYPYRIDQSEKNADQFLAIVRKSRAAVDNGRSFLSSFKRSQTRDDVEKLVDNNGGPNGRVQRDTSSTYPKSRASFMGLHIEDPSKEEMQSDGKIVFPGEVNHHVPICRGSTYCEKVISYPHELVNNAIQRNESLKYLAGVDMVPSISERIDAMDDVPLCVSTEQVIFPQTAENKDNQWKYIANQDNFKQGIRIEKCSNENVSCSMIGGPAEGYKTTCKQKYVYRQLASVLSDGTVVPDTFRFPSSCCCHATFTGNTVARMGVNTEDQKSQITPIKTRRRK